jgi:hypothetical protein
MQGHRNWSAFAQVVMGVVVALLSAAVGVAVGLGGERALRMLGKARRVVELGRQRWGRRLPTWWKKTP